MQRLSRLVKMGVVGQDPLPPPFASWTERGIRIRRNSLHLWAGPAASFKTMVLLNSIMNMKVPTFMFSTDSDEQTIASRMLGILTNTRIEQAEAWLTPASTNLSRASQLLSEYDFIRFDFTPNPTLDDVWNGVYAYATVEGCWPDQIVIDIASDIFLDGFKDEWSMLKALMREGKVLARLTGAAVHLVHHVPDGWSQSLERRVPARGDVLGKLSAIPVLMVNFAPGMDNPNELYAACVKNRFAKCDASGRGFFRMRVNPETGKVTDWTPSIGGVRKPQGENWWQ